MGGLSGPKFDRVKGSSGLEPEDHYAGEQAGGVRYLAPVV